MSLFLTGADTAVGKAHTTVQLFRAARRSDSVDAAQRSAELTPEWRIAVGFHGSVANP